MRRRYAARSALLICLALLVTLACGQQRHSSAPTAAPPVASNALRVVAAENFYGDIVQQLGGSHVSVTSILSDPNADPHEYESSAENAKAIAAARLVVENGVGYDSFIEKLLAASPRADRELINVGQLLSRREGENPHLWYNTAWMGLTADRITVALQRLDPADAAEFTTLNGRFRVSLQGIAERAQAIRGKYAGAHLTQTEAVFGYMGEALGLTLDDGDFQHAIEEGTDPAPQAVAQITHELSNHEVKALLVNSQTTSPTTAKIKELARQKGVPVVGVSETEPPRTTYQAWMLDQLDALQKALGG